jgi:hypothetical protein
VWHRMYGTERQVAEFGGDRENRSFGKQHGEPRITSSFILETQRKRTLLSSRRQQLRTPETKSNDAGISWCRRRYECSNLQCTVSNGKLLCTDKTASAVSPPHSGSCATAGPSRSAI